MILESTSFESVTGVVEKFLKENLQQSATTIQRNKFYWKKLFLFMKEKELIAIHPTICDNFLNYALENKNPQTLTYKDKLLIYSISLLKEYLLYGDILSKKEKFTFDGEIGSVMEEYISEKVSERLSKSSIDAYSRQLSRFLKFLKKQNVSSVKDIALNHVFQYIKVLPPELKTNTYTAICIVKRFLKRMSETGRIKMDLSLHIPNSHLVSQPQIPSVYTRDEIGKLLSSIDKGCPKGKRDYAMILLAARLGLRASDISNLKFENILWEQNLIHITQQKTGRELELPLLSEIGNAIIDYLKFGRPSSKEPYIFLRANSPYVKIRAGSLFNITALAIKDARVDIGKRKCGPHALRHTLAGLLLERSVALPIISETLGHGYTKSTMFYLRIDVKSLSKCMLEVTSVEESFYLQKGGMFYE
jgi:site-specific recombinase XerD